MTHRDYFRRYRLNVAQYGEILVAQAFSGKKLGDAQKGYDVKTNASNLKEVLSSVSPDGASSVTAGAPETACIQVRSKLAWTSPGRAGRASVIHCNAETMRKHGMTHLIALLVHPGTRTKPVQERHREGEVLEAWILREDLAARLCTRPGKVRYISPDQLRKAGGPEILKIAQLLNQQANCALSESSAD